MTRMANAPHPGNGRDRVMADQVAFDLYPARRQLAIA
jgi:hypothetical protein